MSRRTNAFFQLEQNATKDNCDTALRYLEALRKSRCTVIRRREHAVLFNTTVRDYKDNYDGPACENVLDQMRMVSEKCLEAHLT